MKHSCLAEIREIRFFFVLIKKVVHFMNFTSSQVLENLSFSLLIHGTNGFYGHSGDMKVKLNSRSTRVQALL